MTKIAIVFGSTTGNTADVAKALQAALGKDKTDLFDIAKLNIAELDAYPTILLGTSTWGMGDLQDDWESHKDLLSELNLKEKSIALFGLGDQSSYPDSFASAMGILYDLVANKAKRVIGSWPTEGYTFSDSLAVRHGKFVGLVLDTENQESLHQQRIATWCQSIANQLSN